MKLSFFNTAFVRTPLFSLQKYNEIPNNYNDLYVFIQKLWEDISFRDAVYIASPELYSEWKKIVAEKIIKKEYHKVCISVLKYFIRSTSRSTPFGLFSSYSLEHLDSDDPLSKQSYERYTTLDLLIVYRIVRILNDLTSVRNIVRYSVNSSIYRVGKGYRYIEIKLNPKREHLLTALGEDDILDLLFPFLSESKTIKEIADFLLERIDDVNRDEIIAYIEDLIDNQVIVGSFDISINKENPLHQIVSFLHDNINMLHHDAQVIKIYNLLRNIENELREIDQEVFNIDIERYNKIYDALDEIIDNTYDQKFVINSNLKRSESPVKISFEDRKKIKKAIHILDILSPNIDKAYVKSNLDHFKDAFYKRYENRTIPLTTALDSEIGIGYKQGKSFNLVSDLLDDIEWNPAEDKTKTVSYQKDIHNFWNSKLQDAFTNSKRVIDLKMEDLSGLESSGKDLPHTFSVICNKVGDTLCIESVGGSSATNLLGRFSNLDDEATQFISEMTDEEMADDRVLHCELLHVQDDRIGNILARNIKRKYEIAFLTKGSGKSEEIELQDIYLKFQNNKIVLISKKRGKEIKIYNSTAHNYNNNALPIYQFLSDLQNQDYSSSLSVDFDKINENAFNFSPRITYGKDIILSSSYWRVGLQDIKEQTHEALVEFLKTNNVSRHFYLSQGDNILLIDSQNEILTSILFDELKKQKRISLKECIYSPDEDRYANEIVFSVKNDLYKEKTWHYAVNDQDVPREFIPGNEWLYYKIYTGVKVADHLLLYKLKPIIQQLLDEELITHWFFIRYNDPDTHIRLRFKLASDEHAGRIMNLFNLRIKEEVEDGNIWKIELSTYIRELERYGNEDIEKVEELFYYDSLLISNILYEYYENQNNEVSLWMLICCTINKYLEAFKFNDKEKLNILNMISDQFNKEFNIDKGVKKQIDKKYRNHQEVLFTMINTPTSQYHAIIEECFSKMENIIECLESSKMHLIDSIIHMHINRYMKERPRAHEMLIYNLLLKFYKEKVGKLKFNILLNE